MSDIVIDKIRIRRGNIADMPILQSGEFGLAEDEQRLFLGQKPVPATVNFTASDSIEAVVSFYVNENGYTKELDLDGISQFYIKINDTAYVNGVDTLVSNGVISFAHGLGRAVEVTDVFELYYNKEITSYVGERDRIRQATTIQKSLPYGTSQPTGIVFESAIKNSIDIEYFMFVQDCYRKGQLSIIVVGDNIAKISDSYVSQTDLEEVVFSIEALGNGRYSLNFDTNFLDQIQFNYTQISNTLIEIVNLP